MKKFTKIFSVVALCAVMVIMSVVLAFAATNDVTYIEDHSVVDCTHYYKQNGNYYFQIKCPKGQLDKISLGFFNGSGGIGGGSVSFKYEVNGIFELRHDYSDDNYDYTWFIVKCNEYPNNFYSSWEGFGIRIYYFDGENSKMATNTSNGSTVRGPGYSLIK